ncbi:hypothetical protein BTUL_0027g00190 [Botrytis tulipae]|uniref:Uncharacterized protein n=1 Tax=Botrytis tulipae TaxID=87230 RepID=A0A4Z1EYA2_9HELO|nr:hypothetical protein BTUL_0027g00190 [Botrytis tulipae]
MGTNPRYFSSQGRPSQLGNTSQQPPYMLLDRQLFGCILNHKEANTDVETDEPFNGYPNNGIAFKNEKRISVVDRSERKSLNSGPNNEDMITSQRIFSPVIFKDPELDLDMA